MNNETINANGIVIELNNSTLEDLVALIDSLLLKQELEENNHVKRINN